MALAEAVQQALHHSSEAIQHFVENGFAIFPNFFPDEVAAAFETEIHDAYEAGVLEPNKIQFNLTSGSIQLTKPHVFEADLHRPEMAAMSPTFAHLWDDLPDIIHELNTQISSLHLIHNPSSARGDVAIKMQVNTGGGFPLHYDNPGPPNKRQLTLTAYFNSDWCEGYGGELVLLPFLQEKVIVPPLFNTVVLFRSDLIVHGVNLVSTKTSFERKCFSVWFDSEVVNKDEEVNLRAKHLCPSFIPELCSSPLQRSVARAVYDEEYREGLNECFGSGTRDAALALQLHEAHVQPLLRNADIAAFIAELRARKK